MWKVYEQKHLNFEAMAYIAMTTGMCKITWTREKRLKEREKWYSRRGARGFSKRTLFYITSGFIVWCSYGNVLFYYAVLSIVTSQMTMQWNCEFIESLQLFLGWEVTAWSLVMVIFIKQLNNRGNAIRGLESLNADEYMIWYECLQLCILTFLVTCKFVYFLTVKCRSSWRKYDLRMVTCLQTHWY